MALIVARRNIYLHIPKTGGIWLTQVLHTSARRVRKIEAKHATYDLVMGAIRARRAFAWWERGRDWRAFCVVRHPLSWYESWFRYQKSLRFRDYGATGSAPLWHPMAPLNGLATDDFNAFMTELNARAPGFAGALFRSYTERAGARILRTESLRADLLALNADWDLGLDAARIQAAEPANVSPREPIVWAPAVWAETVAHEHATFRLYGYAPDGAVQVAPR